MGEAMSDAQETVRQAIRAAIARFQAREISLGDLIGALDPVVDDVQPEEIWEPVSELFNELDAFYGLVASSPEASENGALTDEQQQNADRIVAEIADLLG